MCESNKWISQTSNLFGHFDDSTNGRCLSIRGQPRGRDWVGPGASDGLEQSRDFAPQLASASNRPPNSRPFTHFARNSRSYRSTAALTHAASTCTMASTGP